MLSPFKFEMIGLQDDDDFFKTLSVALKEKISLLMPALVRLDMTLLRHPVNFFIDCSSPDLTKGRLPMAASFVLAIRTGYPFFIFSDCKAVVY